MQNFNVILMVIFVLLYMLLLLHNLHFIHECCAVPIPTLVSRRAYAPIPSVTLGTPGTALHNLSRDTGDLFTSLSFLLYLLIFPMPRSDYLPRVFLMFSLIYFHSSSGSSINSSTIVGSTQTKI